TCSRLGISLRRIISANGSGRRTADVRGGTIPTPGSVGIAYVREQKEVSQPAARATPLANFAIMMRHRGKEQATDIPLSSAAIEVWALEALSRNLNTADLMGEFLVEAINKDMIRELLRCRGPPFEGLFAASLAPPPAGNKGVAVMVHTHQGYAHYAR